MLDEYETEVGAHSVFLKHFFRVLVVSFSCNLCYAYYIIAELMNVRCVRNCYY